METDFTEAINIITGKKDKEIQEKTITLPIVKLINHFSRILKQNETTGLCLIGSPLFTIALYIFNPYAGYGVAVISAGLGTYYLMQSRKERLSLEEKYLK